MVYTQISNFTADLTELPLFKSIAALKTADEIQQMDAEVKQHLEYSNSKYNGHANQKKKKELSSFLLEIW